MVTPVTTIGATGDKPRYPRQCGVEEYINLNVPKINLFRFEIVLNKETFLICAGFEEPETAYAGWIKR